ncbi:hypothetical protein BJV77DRAFT_1070480 [Russula vinacea]|nr:hypothetical protein BJV77DRAFT_1070480 [Russula vinacea]
MVASNEKVDLLTTALVVQAPRPKGQMDCPQTVALLATVFASRNGKLCPQSDALYPESHAQLWKNLGRDFDEDAFMTRAVGGWEEQYAFPLNHTTTWAPLERMSGGRLSGRLRLPRAVVPPRVRDNFSFLTLIKVNTYGLLYEWKGSDDTLKPLLLAAHQDVVPVEPETVDQWEYPPYSGYYDGKFIWGRGSSDDKCGLIGILASIETLLEKEFKPARTIVLAFGFDEETTGLQGAKRLSDAMLQKYGQDSFALLVDEGSLFSDVGGSIIAIAGIAEKGSVNTKVRVSTSGGHSSVPPAHTSIGILSRLLVEYEANPIQPHLERSTPIYSTVQCVGQYAKNLPAHLRALVKTSVHTDRALRKLETELIKDPIYSALIGSTQAIDLVQGGVKANALPEEAWAVINHRIATQRRPEALAKEFNLTYTAFGSAISPEDGPTAGSLTLTDAFGTALEPAPVTPVSEDSAPWQLFSGTIKATYNAHRGLDGADNIIEGLQYGSTDTRYYWNLTRHIVRYNHHDAGDGRLLPNGIHTVNERMPASNFVEMVRFFSTLILNADENRKI